MAIDAGMRPTNEAAAFIEFEYRREQEEREAEEAALAAEMWAEVFPQALDEIYGPVWRCEGMGV